MKFLADGESPISMRRAAVSMALVLALALTTVLFPGVRATAGPSTDEPATLTDFWNGQAQWTPYTELNAAEIPESNNGGTHIVANGSTWYWVNRYVDWGRRCEDPRTVPIGMHIRSSSDAGMTWSDPVVMIEPGGGTDPGKDDAWGCVGTDGDLWFEPDVGDDGTWYFLFQCVEDLVGAPWNGCLATREGSDPVGRFEATADPENPVIVGGEVWKQICDVEAGGGQPADECVRLTNGQKHQVAGEGTFKVFRKDESGYYWVNFSGAGHPYWFNGIAKTLDFDAWVAGDPSKGVPDDAVLYKGLADNWRESWISHTTGGFTLSNVGFGAGTVFEESVGGIHYTYLLGESQDHIGGCVVGQNWDLGLFRTTDIASNDWDQFPGTNPIVYSSKDEEYLSDGVAKSAPCSAAYPQIFRDPVTGWIYLEISRQAVDKDNHSTFIYRLEKSRNLLKNADFETADGSNWTGSGGIAHAVYRNPSASPDGGQYVEFNCGGPCTGAQVLKQSVDVSGHRGEPLEFGGTFATDGTTQSVTVRVRQLDASGAVVKTDTVTETLGNVYEGIKGSTVIAATASTAEFGVIPNGPYNYCASGFFASPGTGTVPFEPDARTCKKRWAAQDPLLRHNTGVPESGLRWKVRQGTDAAGYMQYGPYVKNSGVGLRAAKWRLMIDNVAADNAHVATLEVFDATSSTVLASRILKRKMFSVANQLQEFSLAYELPVASAGHALEYRVNWTGTGTLTLDSVRQLASPAYEASHTFDANRYHQIGRIDGDGWSADPALDSEGYLSHGPYTTSLESGETLGRFILQIPTPNHTLEPETRKDVAILEVFDATANTVLESRLLTSDDFSLWNHDGYFGENLYQNFEVPFTVDGSISGHSFELRVHWKGQVKLKEQAAYFETREPIR